MQEAKDAATALVRKLGPDKIRLAMYVMAGFLALLLLWRMHPYSKRGTIDCAFRITRTPSTKEQIMYDGVQPSECVQLEKAVTHSSRVRGLSGRKSMDWTGGMLFDFEKPGEYCMWMRDMYFSIDIIWLSEDKEIVSMKENVAPETYPDRFCGPENARYVVEVNAHGVESADLRMGQRLGF